MAFNDKKNNTDILYDPLHFITYVYQTDNI